jgi:glycosyltransferase involved in cell wall biosynthesis
MDILIICYNFPPNPGIGGRRWAKFAKYLVRKGHTVHVISALRENTEVSLWNADVQDPRIHNHRIPTGFPEYFQRPAKSLTEKIRFRLHTAWIKATQKGAPYDASRYWKKTLLPKADELIRAHNIRHVIVTAPPFRTFAHIAALKKMHPAVQLFFDYRDPWTRDVYAYGMQNLGEKDLAFEKQMEKEAVSQADLILTPESHVTAYLTSYGVQTPQRVLLHGWDPEDLNVVADSHDPQRQVSKQETMQSNHREGKINLLYGGTFYVETEPLMIALAEALATAKSTEAQLYQQLNLDLYMTRREMQKVFDERHIENVKYHPPIPLRDYWQKMSEADICLLIFADYSRHNKSSKFFELISIRKPILVLGPRGDAAAFVEEHGLGLGLEAHELQEKLLPSIRRMMQPDFLNRDFDILQYGQDRLTDELIQLLQNTQA